jgi:glutathione S-transferase
MGDIPLGAVAYRYYNVAIERPSERPAYREHVMNFFGTNPDEWQALERQSGPSS